MWDLKIDKALPAHRITRSTGLLREKAMKLDRIDILIVSRAVSAPGVHQRELYRPLLKDRSESFLHGRIKCLEACGFLRLKKNTGTVQVWATPKGQRHIKKQPKMEADA